MLEGTFPYPYINIKQIQWFKQYNFIIGPKLETELEVFILPRTALLARIQQHWNPLSIDKWNTVWNVGIKILLY